MQNITAPSLPYANGIPDSLWFPTIPAAEAAADYNQHAVSTNCSTRLEYGENTNYLEHKNYTVCTWNLNDTVCFRNLVQRNRNFASNDQLHKCICAKYRCKCLCTQMCMQAIKGDVKVAEP
jgi:hypothetical protein